MPVFSKNGKSILFVHIPKTGGTSIDDMFLSAGWKRTYFLSKKARQQDRRHHDLLRCSPQHMDADQLKSVFSLEKFDAIFMVTRNPISRFQSEYVMRNPKNAASRSDKASVDRWANKHLKLLSDNPYALDNHLRPQIDFFLPGAHVFRLEDGLDQIPETLNEHYDADLPETVEHVRDSRKVTGGTSSSSIEISPSLEARLRAVYRDDFSAFGY